MKVDSWEFCVTPWQRRAVPMATKKIFMKEQVRKIAILFYMELHELI